MKALDFILARLSESSTWRGLVMVAAAVGLKLDPSHADAIIAAGLSVVGVINIFRKG
jgi:hypothetical protein